MKLELHPIHRDAARAFIFAHHRHHLPAQGWKFGIAVVEPESTSIHAVLSAGRPVARFLDDGRTLEVTRLCTDGTPHAASMLYAAAWRAGRAMGYLRIITYILESEIIGTSLRAAGWRYVRMTDERSWSRPKRLRTDKHPTVAKQLWERR